VNNPEKEKKLKLSLVGRILSYTRPYKKYFYSAIFITIVLSGFSIVRPLLISKALNNFVVGTADISGLNTIGLLILASLLFEAVLQFTNIYLTSYLGQI